MIGRAFEQDDNQHEDEGMLDDEDDVLGEGFEFDTVTTTETLFKSWGIVDEAKRRPIELGLASDGAQLTNNLAHTSCRWLKV